MNQEPPSNKDGTSALDSPAAPPATEQRKAPPVPKPAGEFEMVAYGAWGHHVKLVPAWKRRDWMDAAGQGFPYHCLPMALANQSGWFVLAAHSAVAEWNGGPAPKDLTVRAVGDTPYVHIASAVGSGIVSWTIPYVFRTPAGWNLLCRGPANYPKDGAAPLEGLVETDWSFASFSMNWKLTRPGSVEFQAGEPIAMLVPQRRGDLEPFRPRVAELRDEPDLWDGYTTWIKERQSFLQAQRQGDLKAIERKYQKHYFTGQTNEGQVFEPHQKARKLKPFEYRPEGGER